MQDATGMKKKQEDCGSGEEKKVGLGVPRPEPLVSQAYGGGLYGQDDDVDVDAHAHADAATAGAGAAASAPASESQSAEGPPPTTPSFVHQPPSTGDRDLDITGQSYIQ